MQIKKIELENFRSFKKQTIELLPNINVFVGVNGAGKSTVLDAIAISLSWLVSGIQKVESRGMDIDENSIKNNTNFSSILLEVSENKKIYRWKNIEFVRGYPTDKKSELDELNALSYYYQEKYQRLDSLPMIAYYPINRIAKGMSGLDIYGRESIAQLDVYDNALGSKANFQAFFEWFRLQDDIINEHTTSRRKWMQNHRNWIFLKLNDAFSHFKDYKNSKERDKFIQRFNKEKFLLDDPRHLLFELMDFLHFMDKNKNISSIEFLLHRMSRLIDRNDEYLIRVDNTDFYDIESTLEEINSINIKNIDYYNFIWDIFLLFLELKFWRLSSKGRKNLENHFKHSKTTQNINIKNFIAVIKNIVEKDSKRLEQALFNQDRELEIVTKTIEKFIPEYSNLRVTRIPTPHMLVEKDGKTIRLDQLSDGEKNMIAMVGDIARRLSMANPRMENPLEGNGIVLIDEIDLHLHPLWQRVIVSKLTEVFPNCQFIVSTHSPQVLSHVKAEHIFMLQPEKNNISVTKPTESYGRSTDRQLEDILGVEARPLKIKEELHQLYKLIQEPKLEEAKQLMAELENEIEGREPELVKADVLIKRKEILGK